MSTTTTVIGTIATDPKLVRSSSGVQLCSFRVASDERRFDREQQAWVEGHTNWFGVISFRALAAHAHESFQKGDRVVVTGKLRVRSWEKDGKRGTSVEVEAEAIGHDLRFGVTRFTKRVHAQAAAPDANVTHESEPGSHGTAPATFTDTTSGTGSERTEQGSAFADTAPVRDEMSADAFTPKVAA